MAVTAKGIPPRDEWIAPVVGLAGVAILAAAADRGSMAYAILFLAAAAVPAGLLFRDAALGRPYAIGAFLIIVLFVVDLKLSEREPFVFDEKIVFKIGTWLAILGVACFRWRSILRILLEPEGVLLFSYAGLAMVSALWSEVPAFSGAMGLGLFTYAALTCMIVTDLREETTIRIFLFGLLGFICAGLLGAVVMPDVAWLAESMDEGGGGARLAGFAGHPNVLSTLTTILLFMAMTARRQNLVGRFAFYGIFALGFATLLATGSRTALVGFLIAWGLVAWRTSRFGGAITMALLSAGACALVLAACGLLPDISGLFGQLSRSGRESEILTLTGRTDIWEIAWKHIAQKPFFGWGYFGTEEIFATNVEPMFANEAKHAHNMFLQSLVSLGFIGSLPGFAYVLLLLSRFVTKPDPTRDQITLLVLVSGFGEPEIFGPPVVATIFFYWVLARDAARRVFAPTFS